MEDDHDKKSDFKRKQHPKQDEKLFADFPPIEFPDGEPTKKDGSRYSERFSASTLAHWAMRKFETDGVQKAAFE
jgi:hypothetical protein